MNIKYKEYLVWIRLNYLYLIVITVSLILLLWYVPRTIGKIFTTNEEINTAKDKSTLVQTKLRTINQYSVYDLGMLSSYVNQLVPDKGDSFSIHTTLDNLITRNGFVDASKNIPAEIADASQEIVVSLGLSGGVDKIPSILADHYYQYGRFFTIDSLSVNKRDSSIAMKLTFLNQAPANSSDPFQSLTPPSAQVLSVLEKELSKSLSPITDTTPLSEVYETSQTPFGITNPPID